MKRTRHLIFSREVPLCRFTGVLLSGFYARNGPKPQNLCPPAAIILIDGLGRSRPKWSMVKARRPGTPKKVSVSDLPLWSTTVTANCGPVPEVP